jgi:hypothetical protein
VPNLLEIIITIVLIVIVVGPMLLAWRSEPLAWDDPQGVPIPDRATREDIAEALNVEVEDIPTEAEIEEELNGNAG